MLIPHLHFGGQCAEAIAVYEKAFGTKAGEFDYRNGQIAHAEMQIHGQTVWLNDAFGNKGMSSDCGAVHLCLTFPTPEALIACYEQLKQDDGAPVPFTEEPYSRLVGNFLDKFGVLWGFVVTE